MSNPRTDENGVGSIVAAGVAAVAAAVTTKAAIVHHGSVNPVLGLAVLTTWGATWDLVRNTFRDGVTSPRVGWRTCALRWIGFGALGFAVLAVFYVVG